VRISDMMSLDEWRVVCGIAARYRVDPILLAAIGWHETHWGRLGAGRRGWYLGYGYYPGSKIAEQVRGLIPQLKGASRMLHRGMQWPVTYQHLLAFAERYWRPGNPAAWARSVWRIYQQLKAFKEPAAESGGG